MLNATAHIGILLYASVMHSLLPKEVKSHSLSIHAADREHVRNCAIYQPHRIKLKINFTIFKKYDSIFVD